MFYRENVILVEVKKFNYNGNERYSYLFHLKNERKYVSMIGSVPVPNFQEDMAVDIEFSMSQVNEDRTFKCFVTAIKPSGKGGEQNDKGK